MKEKFSYQKAGVDIDVADATKRAMAESLETQDARVLNRIGAFASLYDAEFPEYQHPVLVLKSEEPGSKQKLALQHGHVESICYDLINHLINDVIVMGARPLSVQDVIVCGKLEKDVVRRLVAAMAEACRRQECTLTGGETSEQPGVLEAGLYVLTASAVGVVEKSKIIDGSKIKLGDRVIALPSNGLHTNGYSLVRALMARQPEIMDVTVDGEPFIEAILRPHTPYYMPVKGLFDLSGLHGMAHITGGGIQDNLNRILPADVDAAVDRGLIRVPPIFKVIRDAGGVDDADMLRTFNMGVGMTLVVDGAAVEQVRRHLAMKGLDSYVVGEIIKGTKKVVYRSALRW